MVCRSPSLPPAIRLMLASRDSPRSPSDLLRRNACPGKRVGIAIASSPPGKFAKAVGALQSAAISPARSEQTAAIPGEVRDAGRSPGFTPQ
jgi:hypothetical protein